ncbi:MAG: hypothetical protein ACI9WC_002275 [Arenicella sp.]|jgi:hypothetical protein
MFGSNQMTAQIEKVTDSGMGAQKSLSLPDRFEFTHPSLPHPNRLVRLLSSIILVLLSAVDRLRYQLPMSNAITPQFVGNIFLGSPPWLRNKRLKNRFAAAQSRFACR